MNHTLESVYKILNDEDGEHILVSPDSGGYGLIDIALVPSGSNQSDKPLQGRQSSVTTVLTISRAQAMLLIEALEKIVSDIR